MKRQLACCLALGLAGPVPRLPGQANDTASVAAFYREWFGAGPQGMTAYASFYAPDGLLLPPNAPPQRGRAAIAEWMTRVVAERPYVIRPTGITVDEIRFLTPDWVLYRSTLSGQRVPKAGGEPVPFETKYVDVLRRTPEGRWEVVSRMWSDNH